MCWWTGYKIHITGPETCRNIVAIIFNQYGISAGEKMQSIKSEEKEPLPHTISHDERCEFAAIVAAIVGEPPDKGFDQCIKAAEELKKYKPSKKTMDMAVPLAKLIEEAVSAAPKKEKEGYELDEKIKIHLLAYASAIIDSFEAYKKTGNGNAPVGSYSLKYLYSLIR
jgi:hypothetical protein